MSEGDCFIVHGRRVLDRKAKGLLLVHAEVSGTGPLEGQRYGHCWLEDDKYVYDFSNGRSGRPVPKYIYYTAGNVMDEPGKLFKYTNVQARLMMAETEHFGDWELEYEQ